MSVNLLHKTFNLAISRCCFAENGKEMLPQCKTHKQRIVLLIKTYCLAEVLVAVVIYHRGCSIIEKTLRQNAKALELPCSDYNSFRNKDELCVDKEKDG